ncbi:MAG: JAB domain-containing protein [Chordicoccus sp.]
MAKKKETPGQYSMSDYQLKQVDIRLKLMEGPSYYSQTPLTSPEGAAYVMRDILKELDREWVCVVNMDNHLKPVNFNVVSIGSINQSLAPIQNILKSGILSNCNNLMLMHNHPSGDVEPSREDRQLTKRLVEASKLMDMNVIDHLVIGGQNGDVYSFREHDPDMFTGREIDLDYIHRMMAKEEPGQDYQMEYSTSRAEDGKGRYAAGKHYDPKAAAEARKSEMKEITKKLEEGVAGIFSSEKYQKFLDTMARFPQYSLNNSLLIMMQKPDASLVQSYTGWKKMGRFVKRGEKGIRILAPTPFKVDREQERTGADGKPVLDKDGEPMKETVQISMVGFKPVSTFDISQTEGEPVPTLGVDELKGSVDHYAALFTAMKEASPVSVGFEDIRSGAKGYFHTTENRIAIREGMDEIQNVKTLIHEMAHAKLHNVTAQKERENGAQTQNSKEVEAESVAYTVCQHYGIDTSDYSFGYIAGWSGGKEMQELKESLSTIREASSEMISSIDEKMQELTRERDPVLLSEKIDRLAADLDQYAFDRDTYGYQDAADSREEGIHQIREQLEQGKLSGIQESIRQDLVEGEGSEDELRPIAEALLARLDVLEKELKESREDITADGDLHSVSETMEKHLESDQTDKTEDKKEPVKVRAMQQKERTSVLQKLSKGKEKTEKSLDQMRKPRGKSPER